MPLLILGVIRAIWALRRDAQFVSLGLLTVIAIVSGTGFYALVEGLGFVDALYFSVVTLTTVGYGDFTPKTDAGKLFTVVYVLVGIGILLTFVTTLAAKMSQASPLHPFAPRGGAGGSGEASPRPGSVPRGATTRAIRAAGGQRHGAPRQSGESRPHRAVPRIGAVGSRTVSRAGTWLVSRSTFSRRYAAGRPARIGSSAHLNCLLRSTS
jgi:voltage-gated potassium channel